MRTYNASSHADAAAWLRAQIVPDDLGPQSLDHWEQLVIEQLDERPLPRQICVDVYTDGRLTRAAQLADILIVGHWPEALYVILPPV